MSLQRRDFDPNQPHERPSRPMPASPPLMRFFSAIGFGAVSITVSRIGMQWIGVSSDDLIAGKAQQDWRFALIFIVAVLAGLVAGLIGAGIGLSIPVRNDKLNFILTTIWHYLANGLAGWFGLIGAGLIIFFRDNVNVFWSSVNPTQFMIQTLTIGSVGSFLIGLFLLIGQQVKPGEQTSAMTGLLIAGAPGMAAGYMQAELMGIDPLIGVISGLVFVRILMYFSGSMIERDIHERQTMANRQT